jgi:hypothetical protein
MGGKAKEGNNNMKETFIWSWIAKKRFRHYRAVGNVKLKMDIDCSLTFNIQQNKKWVHIA